LYILDVVYLWLGRPPVEVIPAAAIFSIFVIGMNDMTREKISKKAKSIFSSDQGGVDSDPL